MRPVSSLGLLLLGSCVISEQTASFDPDSITVGDCPGPGYATARIMDADDALPGRTAVGTEGDLILANHHAAYVITEPDKGSTYYHYGGIVADAVSMDGCRVNGEDKLDEVGLILAEVQLEDYASSVLRAFRGETAVVLNDGSDGEAAVVRVTGTDDFYWLVEYTLVKEAYTSDGVARGLSEPFGLEVVVDYILEPDSPVLRAEMAVTNVGEVDRSLVAASLLSFGHTMDTHGYSPYTLEALGLDLDYGMPFLVASDGEDAIAYGVEDGSLAYLGIGGIDIAIDVSQALTSPISVGPGDTDRRAFFLSVGEGGGGTATEDLAEANPVPIPDVSYTLGWATGQVVDPAGVGVAGAEVRVQARAPDADWGTLDTVVSAADGSFEAPLMNFEDSWDWRLVGSIAGRHDSDAVEVVDGDTGVSLGVSALGSLAYSVVDGEGAESPARVELRGDEDLTLWLDDGGTTPVPPGVYTYTATRGYEYGVVTGELTVPEEGVGSLELVMEQLVDTSGWVSVDTHVHSADSPDSRTDPVDVLGHAAAHGLDIVVHTEHEAIVDKSTLPATTGYSRWVSSIDGEEVTATVPEHMTMFPAESDGTPRGGIVEWYGHDIDELFGMMRERSGGGVNLINHPGYLDDIDWDRIVAEPGLDDPTMLGLLPDAALWSWDLDGLEVMNGHGRPFDDGNGRWNNWQSMLNAGQPLVAVGCSDDHGGDEVGFPRSYVPASSDAGREVSDQEVVDAFQAGQLVVSAGAFARVWLGEAGLGELVTVDEDTSEVDLDVHIEAIPEVDVTFVSVFVNCDEVLTVAATDPEGIVKLSDTLTVELPEDSDAHITLAAFGENTYPDGLPRFSAAGVPRVLTNPIYVDTDGNGVFDAPGGRECAVYLTGPE